MFGLEEKTLYSEHLAYRPINDGDRAAFKAMLSDPAVTRPAGFLPAENEAQFDEFFVGLRQADLGITILLDGQPIGYLRPYKEMKEGNAAFVGKMCAGVGFVIGKQWQNQGLGTEMLSFLTKHLKQYCDFVFADAFTDNPASNKLIQKCGYRYVEDYSMFFEALGETKTCHSYVY